jgi:hypothetical protein
LILPGLSLLSDLFPSTKMTILKTSICFLIHVMNLLCIMMTLFLIEMSLRDDNNLFDEFMDHPFKVQILNPKSNSIDTFIIIGKASIGWHVLEVSGHFLWVLISIFSSPYTYVG